MTLIHRISILAATRAKVPQRIGLLDNKPEYLTWLQILKHRPLTPSEIEVHARTTVTLHDSLITLNQRLPSHSGNRTDLEAISHIKHLAAILYLTERLGPVNEAQAILGGNNHNDSYRPTPAGTQTYSKHHLITSIITSISFLSNTNTAALLWPLFVLGNAGLENEEHRRFVLDRLLGIQRARNLGSVRRTIEAVKHAFGTKGLGLVVHGANKMLAQGTQTEWGNARYRFISLA
jgi:hypothetical protein